MKKSFFCERFSGGRWKGRKGLEFDVIMESLVGASLQSNQL